MSFRLFDAPPASQAKASALPAIDRPAFGEAQRTVRSRTRSPNRRPGCCCCATAASMLARATAAFDAYHDARRGRRARRSSTMRVLLGFTRQGPVLAVPAASMPEALPETIKAIDLPLGLHPGSARAERPRRAGARGGTARLACQPCASAANAARRPEMRAGGYRRALPDLRRRAFSAHRPGGDHARRSTASAACSAAAALRARHVFGARRLHRAGRDDRGRGAPRDAGGSGHPARPRRLSRQPALAVSRIR